MTSTTRGTLDPAMVGATVGPMTHVIDARWLMAYAAGLGETDATYFDTLSSSGPLAHPLFPVCYEWPVAVVLRDKTIAQELQPQSVHATHHLVIHRLPRAGDTLRTTARVTEVVPRRAGTLVISRFETVDAGGNPVSTTDYGSVYRDVALAGNEAAPAVEWQEQVGIAASAAWVYTECARIWNPIHTDVAVAKRAGLSEPILHGTATLALAVSRVIAHELGGAAAPVREIRARFSGMVPMPSIVIVRGRGRDGARVAFDAVSERGAPILSEGVVNP